MIHCLSLLFTWPKIILVTVLCFISHRFALVVFRHHFLLFFNLSALKRILSTFSSQLSFIICFHYGLFFPVTSHLSLHFPQLKIAIMDISNQVSFDFHSLSLFCHLFPSSFHSYIVSCHHPKCPVVFLRLLLIALSSLSPLIIIF